MGKENNEIKKAYDELLKTKNKCGKYSKTLFHIHTPASHIYNNYQKNGFENEKEQISRLFSYFLIGNYKNFSRK